MDCANLDKTFAIYINKIFLHNISNVIFYEALFLVSVQNMLFSLLIKNLNFDNSIIKKKIDILLL